MPDYWFISDTHFRHRNIIKYCGRPFYSIEEHDEILIKNWNGLVKPGDVVWHHGDLGFFKSVEEANRLLSRLNGQIHLLKGNHDSSRLVKKFKVAELLMLKEWRVPPSNVKMISMCHYPMDTYRGSHRGEWHTHGHTHAMLGRGHRLRLDVGVDCKDGKKYKVPKDKSARRKAEQDTFRPLHLDEVVAEFRRQERIGWMSEVEKHDFPDWKNRQEEE